MSKFTPIFDRVVIKRSDSNLKKNADKSGIILPDTVKNSYEAVQGVLLKCGDTCADEVKALVGKEVLFAGFSGQDMEIDGEKVLLATDRDIFGGLE